MRLERQPLRFMPIARTNNWIVWMDQTINILFIYVDNDTIMVENDDKERTGGTRKRVQSDDSAWKCYDDDHHDTLVLSSIVSSGWHEALDAQWKSCLNRLKWQTEMMWRQNQRQIYSMKRELFSDDWEKNVTSSNFNAVPRVERITFILCSHDNWMVEYSNG